MKPRFMTWLQGAVLAFCLGFSAIGCISTGFSLPMVDLQLLGLLCALTAIAGGFCYCFRLSLVPLGAVALSAGYLWQSGLLEEGMEALLYRISLVYHGAYNWPILQWSGRSAAEMDGSLSFALCLLGVLMTLVTAWTVCRGKSALWATLPAVVPVFACFVVTDTLPSVGLLFLFLATFLVMMFTSHSRRKDAVQANRLTAMVTLPVVLALGALFLAVPQSAYEGQDQAKALRQTLFGGASLEQLFDRMAQQTVYTGTSVDASSVDLSRVGIRMESATHVMWVDAPYTGTMYLRGRALDGYSGTQWYDTESTDWYLPWPDTSEMNYVGGVKITTRYAHRMLYLPYYVRNVEVQEVNRGMENTEKLAEYAFSVCVPQDSSYLWGKNRQWQRIYGDYGAHNEQFRDWMMGYLGVGTSNDRFVQYTDLPESTRVWAQGLLNRIIRDEKDYYQVAQKIGSYVRNSAKYDLETWRMPTREKDFCRWFLEDSDTGYCVHFASAATVLLKAAGIPARYVTGYMVEVNEGETAIVRGRDAHAWAEYWLPGYGWTILEATPAAQEDPVIQTTAPTQTQEQTAAPTRPADQQTEPTEQTVSIADQKEEPGQTGDRGWDSSRLLTVLWWLLGSMGAIGGLLGQWRLRLWLRRRRFSKGSTNQRILARWQDAVWLCRVLKKTPEAELLALAEKAKFSQYTLRSTELEPFLLFRQEAVTEMESRNIFLRLWYRLVLAAY